jgi:hypothetical protein
LTGENATLELRASVRAPAREATAAARRPLERPVAFDESGEGGGCVDAT